MDCLNCGHTYFNAGQMGDTLTQGVCDNCGAPAPEPDQPSPLHSDGALRNMPGPGEEDSGGNPMAEGVFGSGGESWNGRLKHDDSFGSLLSKVAGPAPQPGPAQPEQPFPIYHDELTPTGYAGGSNGSQFAQSPDGRQWLMKGYGGDQNRIASELLANSVYRHLGVNVPTMGLHANGGIAYPLAPGRPEYFSGTHPERMKAMGRNFMSDALLGNWDFIGLDDDNVLWNGNEPTRVDHGGTFEYRAQGAPKPYGPHPDEVESMRNHGQGKRGVIFDDDHMRQQAAHIHQHLTPDHVDRLVDAAPFEDEAMRERIRQNMNHRVKWMGDYAHGGAGTPQPFDHHARTDIPMDHYASDFEVEQVIEAGPHTIEVDGIVMQHEDPAVLEHAKTQLEASRRIAAPALVPLEMAAAPAEAAALGAGAEAVAGGAAAAAGGAADAAGAAATGLSRGVGMAKNVAGRLTGFLNGGSKPAKAIKTMVNVARGVNTAQNLLGGGGQAPYQPGQTPPQLLSSFLPVIADFDSGFDHPSTDDKMTERNGDDPEKVDPHEFKDGDDKGFYDDADKGGNGAASPFHQEVISQLESQLPLLLHYFDGNGGGHEDPMIHSLVEAFEKHHPGFLDEEDDEQGNDHEVIALINSLKQDHDEPGGDDEGITKESEPDDKKESSWNAYLRHAGAPVTQVTNPLPGAVAADPVVQNSAPVGGPAGTPLQSRCPYCGGTLTPGQPCAQCHAQVPGGSPGVAAPGQAGIIASKPAPKDRTCPKCGSHTVGVLDDEGASVGCKTCGNAWDADTDLVKQKLATKTADNIAPKCPNCGSHTTDLTGGNDSDSRECRCKTCTYKWKMKDDVIVASVGRWAITSIHHPDESAEASHAPNATDDPAPEAQPGAPDPGGWVDDQGQPLQEGATYDMKNPTYAIPDQVTIDHIKPDGLVYTIAGTMGMGHQVEVTKQEAEMDGLQFTPSAGGMDNIAPSGNPEGGTDSAPMDAAAAGQQTDLSSPHMTMASWNERLDRHAGAPPMGDPSMGGGAPPAGGAPDPSMMGAPPMAPPPPPPPGSEGHQGPQTQEQFAAVAQLLQQTGRSDEITTMLQSPQDYADELAQVQHKDTPPPAPEGQSEPVPAQEEAPPGDTMPMPNPADNPQPLSSVQTNVHTALHGEQEELDLDEQSEAHLAALEEGPGPDWLKDELEGDIRTAGANFTPMEQRELIDESGEARNMDKLDLSNTHYLDDEEGDMLAFMWGG